MAKAKKSKARKAKAKKSKAKKAKKSVRRAAAASRGKTRKTQAGKTKAKKSKTRKAKKVARKAAKPKAKAAKKTISKAAPKKKKQIVGEGDYRASRSFLKDEANFVKRHSAEIPTMGKDAEAALEGPEGASLRAAEDEARSHSKAPE
ncbi:MAG TPA: hypothetical protein VN935_01730 [Rhizomicrobium sp.]|jgi:hypothetical protein|nr:hypothetical protein [Rhizomicrobium sp.]